LIRFD